VRLAIIDTRLPWSVQTLQLGGLCNAFGNGIVLPFTLIYLHNVRGISLSVAGLVIGTNAAVALVAGPVSGPSSTASAAAACSGSRSFCSRSASRSSSPWMR
jgi:hypothetical protein